jgi:hypothetical protein
VDGLAASPYIYLVAGTHNLTYTYSGDAVYAPSSANVTVTVRKVGQLPGDEFPNMTFTGLFSSQPMTATVTFGILGDYVDFAPLQGQMTVFLDGHPVVTRPMSSLTPQLFGSLAVTDTFPASPTVHRLKWVWPGDANHIDINYGEVTFDRTPAAWDADHSTLTVTKVAPDTYDVQVQVRDVNGNPLPDYVLGLAVTITCTGATSFTFNQAASTQSFRKATVVWKPRSPTDTVTIGTMINTGSRLAWTILAPFTRSVVLTAPSKLHAVPR